MAVFGSRRRGGRGGAGRHRTRRKASAEPSKPEAEPEAEPEADPESKPGPSPDTAPEAVVDAPPESNAGVMPEPSPTARATRDGPLEAAAPADRRGVVDGDTEGTPAASPGDGWRRIRQQEPRLEPIGRDATTTRKTTTSTSTIRTSTNPGIPTRAGGMAAMATMGQSIVFKGELSGEEDLELEGQVDGVVTFPNHQLTIGANGRITAEVNAKSIVVIGQVVGNLTASERIEIQATGVVQGDLRTPRLHIQEGAVLNGSVDMSAGSGGGSRKPSSDESEPASVSEVAARKSA